MKVMRKRTPAAFEVAIDGLLRAGPRSLALYSEFERQIDSGISELRLDLRNVLFVDSLWLGLLVSTNLRCSSAGVTLVIVAWSRQVANIVRLARLDRVLPQPKEPVAVERAHHRAVAAG